MSIMSAVLAVIFCAPVAAAKPECRQINVKLSEFVITPFVSANDPFGRAVLASQGSLNAVGTAVFTSPPVPGVTPGTLVTTTSHVFVESPADQLTTTGTAVFTFIPGSPNVYDVVTMTVTGGTGKYAGATGTLVATGVGFNFLPAPSAANKTYYEFILSGELCLVN